jgi:hypothetical protein
MQSYVSGMQSGGGAHPVAALAAVVHRIHTVMFKSSLVVKQMHCSHAFLIIMCKCGNVCVRICFTTTNTEVMSCELRICQ